jgi:hypothetical protein
MLFSLVGVVQGAKGKGCDGKERVMLVMLVMLVSLLVEMAFASTGARIIGKRGSGDLLPLNGSSARKERLYQ